MRPSPLSSSELQLLGQVLSTCTVGTVIVDMRRPGHPIVYANAAFELLSGCTAAELVGQNCRFLQGHDRDQPAAQEIRQAIAQERSTTVVLRGGRQDGTTLYNELTLSPIHDAAGTLTYYLGLQNDVTRREELQHQQRQIQQHLTSTLARVTDGVVSFDDHWNLTYLNPAAAALAAQTPEKFAGWNLLTAFPNSPHQAIGQALQRAKSTGTVQHEVSFAAEVGRWLEATVYPAEDGISLLIRDVTQQREQETELWEGEERFEKVFQACPIGILVTRLSDGTHLDANPEFLRQSGYEWEEVIGRTSHDLNFWSDPAEFEAVKQTLRAQESVRNREMQFRAKSAQLRITVTSIVPVTIGGETCVVTLVQDVTHEREARELLEKSEERYRKLTNDLQRTLDLSLDLIATIDADGRFVSINAVSERMLGYTPAELIGRAYIDFVHLDDHAVTAAEDASITGGRPTTVFQNRYVHKAGHTVWLEWAAVVMPRDPLMYCVARDITQRRIAEEDQAFLASIVEASHNAIIGLNLDGSIRSWNPGAEHLYGYATAEVIGQQTNFLVPVELRPQEADICRRVSQGQRSEPFESVNTTKDGRQLTMVVTISAVLNTCGTVVGLARISRDITARRQAEQEVQVLNEDLRRQVQHITGLREIDQAIAAGGDLGAILGLILENICHQLGADAATALMRDPQTQGLQYIATCGLHAAPLQGLAEKLDHELAGRVVMTRQPLIVPALQTATLTPEWHDLRRFEGVTWYYAAPLIAKGRVLGVIEVLRQRRFEPSAAWLETVDTLVGQAAIAVENAQLLKELEQRNVELRLAYDETIEGWARALDLRDKETEGHSRRVTEMTLELCHALGFPPEELVNVRRGALLHDIGKMGIPDAILLKPGQLSAEEWARMKRHPGYAVDLLSPIEFLLPALDIPQYHHEKWDGSGYPLGLRGDAIPLAARAFAVVDVYDALTSDRPYRPAWTRETTIAHIQHHSGSHFDPEVVKIFVRMLQPN